MTPSLSHEIEGDTLPLKWVNQINATPVKARLRPAAAANAWDIRQEEHVIAEWEGVPVKGIDFTDRWP